MDVRPPADAWLGRAHWFPKPFKAVCDPEQVQETEAVRGGRALAIGSGIQEGTALVGPDPSIRYRIV